MGIYSFATSLASKASSITGVVPALYKFKKVGHRAGVLGIAVNILYAGVLAVQQGNPDIFVNQLGYSFFALDQGITQHVSTLTSSTGVLPFWEFAVVTLGIYSKLWLLFFITGKITSFREKSAVGDNAPDYALYLETLVFIVTPLQFAGAFIFELLMTGNVTSMPSVWGGMIDLILNLDVWFDQLMGNLVKLPFVSEELFSKAGNTTRGVVGDNIAGLGNGSESGLGNSTENISNTSTESGGSGVVVIGGGG